jgi:hypothetical protein
MRASRKELDEGQVGAEQPGDAPQAGQQSGEVVDLADAALAPPQPHDRDRVGRDEHRHVPSRDPASLARDRHVACEGDGDESVP